MSNDDRQSSFDRGYTELNEVTHTKSKLQTHSDTQQENRSDHFMNSIQTETWMTLEVKVNHLRTGLYSDVDKFNILGSVFLSACW